ncbi:uncharacterized protein LOC108034470 [Drosophila biarmipes]|uniref:uncharacterized protein LOC108034470 n=1 Tax=Drosophila biarmipes TaxID=125945 RepID=UPI0021CD00FC|nr:uncharacterized protein LOC108034470 [Drosophila biarmipes]
MIWLTCFFAAAAANSLSGLSGTPGMNQLQVKLYVAPETVYGGDSFDVFCSYNASFVTQQNFLFSNKGDRLDTVPVNNFTIMHRTLNTPEEGGFYSFLCRTDDHNNWIVIAVIPKLNVKDFECISKGDELVVVCSFSQLGSRALWESNKYFLNLDNANNHRCQAVGTRIECSTKYSSATTENLNHTFVLQLNCNNDVQEQIFHLSRTQMKVPPWPNNWSIITKRRGTLTCIEDLHYGFYEKHDWKLLLVPRDPRIVQQELEPIRQYHENEICFRIPRYNNHPSNCARGASPPERPPQLIPGFFYDPDKKNLHIFWTELEELEFNKLDLGYIVETETGEKALSKTNTSAVFHQWDPTLSATVLIWSQNSVGQSENSSKMEVPVLTNSELRQPQDLWYNIERKTLIWKPPKDVDKLIEYIVILCSVSSNSPFICDDRKALQSEPVPASKQEFRFETQAADLNKAVVALYEDGSSGGMAQSL